MMMQRMTKKKYENKTCTSKVDKKSKNSIARIPPTQIQTRTQKCKVKENHFFKSQRSSRKDQISMQSCSKAKDFRSALKREIFFPGG
jgi:hypothetical protein